MKKESIWLDKISFDEPVPITKNLTVDVLIIGGGITGLSTAYHLKNSKLKICVVEKNLIAHAVTSKTTAKLTFLQENIYSKLKDKAKLYYESQKDAIEIVEKIIKTHSIECNYQKVESYIWTNNEKDINKIKDEEKKLKELKVNYKITDKLPNNYLCKYGIGVKETAVFHPIKYLKRIKNIVEKSNINVYENSCVTSIDKKQNEYICKVNNYTVTAKIVVVASHYPFFLLPLLVPLRTYIERSYVSASKIDKSNYFSAITVSKPVKSLRYHNDIDNYLIYLNGSHNLCNKYNYKKNFNNLILELRKQNIKPDYIWSNHDIMTEDSLPYIGYIDHNLLIGTGYNTWGMTNGSLAGKIISDLILKNENKYQKLFDPKRNIEINNILKYPLHISYNIKSFLENKIIKNKNWYNSNIIFKKVDGKNIAIYIDEFKKEHIVYNLCPHLKCSLIFNEIEKTWDCPCHGSRFDIDGKCIFGPSKKDIGYKKNN